MTRSRIAWLLLPLLAAGCAEEDPVGIGSELLPGQALRTFEVVLEPAQYLLRDTSFALYGELEDVDFHLLARDFEGALNAHGFARFQLPTAIAVTDTLGVARTDSAPRLVRGEVVLYLDTLAANTTTGSFRVALHRLAEPWNPAATDWEYRGEGLRWNTPGGTIGTLIDTALVSTDSIVLHVDSATMQQWADTTNALRGARLSLLEGPSRLRSQPPRLKVYARSRYKPDTVFTVVSQAPEASFDFRPRLSRTAADPRVSGVPGWRSFLQFRPDLEALVVSCGPGCSVRLGSTSITRAQLELVPVAPPPGFTPELPIQPAAYQALIAPEFPLERTPVGRPIGTLEAGIEPDRFRAGAAPAYLVLTEFLRQAVADTTGSSSGSTARTDWITILQLVYTTVGVGTFAPAPRLRLVLSTAREIQLP